MDYSKYHFNYFDVIKRHERIINRPKDWEIKVLAIIMLMVTFIYTFTNFGFCSEVEDVEAETIGGLSIASNRNYFMTSTGSNISNFIAEPGYYYTITANNNYRIIVTSSERPASNIPYDVLHVIETNEDTFTFIVATPQYISVNGNTSTFSVTRQEFEGQSSAVNNLVDNVGINQFWGVFENGISFVGVVVLVAFGLFLVVLAIKKVSKGKSEF